MTQGKKVHVTVGEEQKSRWSEYVDESPEVSSLAELIRRGTETFIQSEGRSTEPTQDAQSVQKDDYGEEIIEGLRGLERSVDDIQEDIDTVQRMMDEPPEITSFEARVYAALPSARPESSEYQRMYGTGDNPSAIVLSGKSDDITTHILGPVIDDYQEERVERTLTELQSNGLVESDVVNGELRYWRTA